MIADKLQGCVISHSWITMSLTRYFDHFHGNFHFFFFFLKSNSTIFFFELSFPKGFGNNILTHTGRIYEVNPSVVGVSPNYLETTFSEEFVETLESSDTGLDVI